MIVRRSKRCARGVHTGLLIEELKQIFNSKLIAMSNSPTAPDWHLQHHIYSCGQNFKLQAVWSTTQLSWTDVIWVLIYGTRYLLLSAFLFTFWFTSIRLLDGQIQFNECKNKIGFCKNYLTFFIYNKSNFHVMQYWRLLNLLRIYTNKNHWHGPRVRARKYFYGKFFLFSCMRNVFKQDIKRIIFLLYQLSWDHVWSSTSIFIMTT